MRPEAVADLELRLHADSTIVRSRGLAWNEALEAGGVLVGDDVEVILDVEATPARP